MSKVPKRVEVKEWEASRASASEKRKGEEERVCERARFENRY